MKVWKTAVSAAAALVMTISAASVSASDELSPTPVAENSSSTAKDLPEADDTAQADDIKFTPDIVELNVPDIPQNPELPTGCESVALTIALAYEGYDIGKTTIADDYLIYSDNFAEGYVGNPRSTEGCGIFPPGLTETANKFLKAQNAEETAKDISGSDFSKLLDYVAMGKPVVIWHTMYMMEPEFTEHTATVDDRVYTWYYQEHCMVLSGYNRRENTVTVSDPLEGIRIRNLDEFARIYETAGKYAMIIE